MRMRISKSIVMSLAGITSVLAATLHAPADAPRQPAPSFARDIRPILADKCFACHGQDEKARTAGIRLDTLDGARSRGASGLVALVPGRPDKSNLMARITDHGPKRMPPAASGKPVSAREADLIRRWIAAGAEYSGHWAFQKLPTSVKLPPPTSGASGNQPIDRFIRKRLSASGLKMSPQADRYTLARRVALDLIGLPPTPSELSVFVNDSSANAYERYVDSMLASPHFGERWARPWMDLARFADSAGYGSDPLRPNIWPWRDWVINALNANMPYDQFTTEQLAGDLLPNATESQKIATAFHRNTMTNTEGGTDREEFRTAAVKDRTIVTMQVWMGLTMQCAQCHSHKFDPITRREFYRMMAFFNQTEDNDQPDESPTMPLLSPEQRQKRADLQAQIDELKKAGDAASLKLADSRKKELDGIKAVALPVMRELGKGKLRTTSVLTLGNFLQKEDAVDAASPEAFHPWPKDAPLNRLGVAKWLMSRENPLTSRVAVNRVWSQLFGTGLVVTEEDFGHQGSLPSHPELLDWLAVGFMTGDYGSRHAAAWDFKALIKTIVLSETYRQSSRVDAKSLEKDPLNTLLWRYPRRRLDAEGVRDQSLALSGLLSHKIGGPSVFPPQPDGMWQAAFNGDRTYPTSKGEDRYRRGLYTFWRRTVPHPSMATFDAPSREVCTLRRIQTNTPLQALVTLNDPAYLEMAVALAKRIMKEGGLNTEERARYAVSLVTSRPATERQALPVVELVERQLMDYQSRPADAAKLVSTYGSPQAASQDASELAAWTVAANVLLNLDSVMSRN